MTTFAPARRTTATLPDWRALAEMTDDELAGVDVAVMNLACAAGLPGGEAIDYPGCLETLDRWADVVGQLMERNFDHLYRPRPERYDHSESLFRAVMLVKLLQKFCGVRYNPTKTEPKPSDPYEMIDVFIHGVTQGPGGTCANLPVVYAAVGRRLGYPLRLVKAKGHLFNRWDDPATGERFNFDGATRPGSVNTHPDDYYRVWPSPVNEDEEWQFGYLKSLTARDELAKCIGTRAHQWKEHGNYRAAVATYVMAAGVARQTAMYPWEVRRTADEWEVALLNRRPPGFPDVQVGLNERKPRWPVLPWELEARVRWLEVLEDVLDDPDGEKRWWAPLRQGKVPATKVPVRIRVDRSGG